MIRKKALVLFQIGYLSIPILVLLKKICKLDIYFINKERINKIKYLERKDIKWIKKEYREFSHYIEGMFLASELAKKIYDKTKFSAIHSLIDRALIESENHRKKMGVAWKYYLFRGIGSFAEQYSAALFLKDSGRYDSVTVIAFNSLAYFLELDKIAKINIHILPGLFFYKITDKIIHLLLGRINSVKRIFAKKIENPSAFAQEEQYRSRPFNPEDVKVIYFPHQGIFFSDLFTKDHFYNEDKRSSFHKSKILHISLGEKKASYMHENYQYYVENDIPFIDITDIQYDKSELLKSVAALFLKMNIRLIADLIKYGFWYILYSFFLFVSIKRYCLIFSRFKNAEVALIGYDYLFPRNLSMALRIAGIKVCAAQERLILAFWPDDYYIFDYYFVAGNVVVEKGLKNSIVDHCIPVGMLREDTLYYYEKKNIFDEKYDTIKKNKKLVLALDYHMPDDEIEDIMRPAAKVHQTRQFYRDLILLAHEFPYIHIVIKGKIAELYKSPYIADIVEEIKKIENIEIELNLKKYNPYFLSEKADLTIACHTSLADELLAAGRKVIFYEATNLMETLLTYDDIPIIVKNYIELKHHVENIFQERYLDESLLKILQDKYYANCFHGEVQKIIHDSLENIIKKTA